MEQGNDVELRYRPAIVAFIDLLGFRQLVEDTEDVSMIKDIVDKFQKAAQTEFVKMYEELYDGQILFETAFFSDSVVRITYLDHPVLTDRPYGSVFNELLALAYLSNDLLQFGILPRGGVTAGMIYVDSEENQFFGPAMNRAAEMENTVKVPCIQVDDIVLEIATLPQLKSVINSDFEELEYINGFLRQDQQGFLHLDAYEAALSELDYGVIEWMTRVRDFIRVSLVKFANNPNVLTKYKWLESRHNETVNKLDPDVLIQEFDIEKDDLYI